MAAPTTTEAKLRARFMSTCYSSDVDKRTKQLQVCQKYYDLALALYQLVPEGDRLTVALTELEGSMLWSIAALT